jgi:small subunit ribosomal protein S6
MAQAAAVPSKRLYETIYTLNPNSDRATAEGISERMKEVIGRSQGVLTKVENWGRRRLAYPMKRHTRGVYVYFEYQGGGGLVAEVERNLRMLDAVLKFQTVKTADTIDESKQINPEDLKFEHVEPDPADQEETLEQRLGLAPRAGYRTGQDDSRYDTMDDDGGDGYGDEGDGGDAT